MQGCNSAICWEDICSKSRWMIDSSIDTIEAKRNIKGFFYNKIYFPLVVVPSILIMLRKLQKEIDETLYYVKATRRTIPYDIAVVAYRKITAAVERSKMKNEEYKNITNSFLCKMILLDLKKVEWKLEELHNEIKSMLFIKPNNIILTEKEKESFEFLNEVWGEDDGTYARNTFNHLTRN